jgi:Tol biopolymer transport system component
MKMSVDDGSMQYIDIVDAKGLSKVDISSDGRFLAYHRLDKTTSKNNIFIFDLLENRESVLVRDPADDKLLGWTPDGQHIFFTSDRMGTSDGWLLAVQQGKPKGLSRMIKPGLGDVVPIRLTRDGSLYYTVQYEAWNVYTVELDVAAGKAMSEPKAVRDMGKDGSPDWSPDGRYLAYCSQPDPENSQVIRIRTLATGEERELKPDLPHFEYLRWHPDSRHLLAPYLKSAGLAGVSQIDIQTGQCRDLLTSPVVGSERIREAEMSSDGKTLAYRTRRGKANRLIVKDMETGREELLLSTENTVQNRFHGGNSWALLPEGKQVALSFLDNGTYQLKIMSVADKTTTTIVPSYSAHLTCINDGRELLFVRGKDRKELWRVASTGSEPQKVWECERLIINPRLHPDGRHLAFVSGTFLSEMWLMENFLPTTVVAVAEPRPKPAMTLRKVLPEKGDFANVSPDGKYLCDVDWDDGNLYIRELSTGRRWTVTDKKSWEDSREYALDGAISPDSQHVAYLWHDDASDSSSLYTVGLDGSDRKLLCKDTYAIPCDWSADGSKILAIVDGKPYRMVWISASDGSIQQIKDIGKEYPGKFDVSPDGRFLAYDLPQAEDTKTRDVFLLDLHDNREIRLAEHPANDRLLGWTPDGKSILFASDRSDKWDAWLLRIRDGAAAGLSRLVKANIGDVGAVGFASNGDYYFNVYDLRHNVYVAQFDPAKGALLSRPARLRPAGKSGEPVFSPDGRHLAYACRGDGETSLIGIWSLASGQERELGSRLPRRLHSWAPDGKSLLLSGFLEEGWYNAVCTLDVQTGKHSELLRHKDMSVQLAQWFPDGKRLLYHGHHGPNPARKRLGYLMIRDMDSGAEREIARGEFWKNYQWALSPDGSQLAVHFKKDNPSIKIFSTETDEVREVLAGELADKVAQIIWSPDGKDLMLRVLDLSVSRKSEIWRIAAEGGKPEKLSELDVPEYVIEMQIDPTGRHIALEAITNLHELWVMENFLPEDMGK